MEAVRNKGPLTSMWQNPYPNFKREVPFSDSLLPLGEDAYAD